MTLKFRTTLFGAALCALIFANSSASRAATIIKLDLGNVGPDVGMNAVGVLGTVSDGNAATTGDQDTRIEYTGFLDPLFADVANPPLASFTLSNLVAAGPAQQFGTLVIQNYAGGTFNLYNPANVLLLSGNLNNSALAGAVGPPGTGGLFTTGISNVTGGTLAAYIIPNTLTLSMNLSNVNGGAGLSVTGNVLNPFLGDSSVGISGDSTGVPEPATMTLVLLSGIAACGFSRRRVC